MFEDFDRETLLEGTWVGEYFHDHKAYGGQGFPITATFALDGSTIRGTMIDGITDHEVSLKSIVDADQGRISTDAMIKAKQTLANSPNLKVVATLPKESQLEGKLDGDSIRFAKTYLGTHQISLVDENQRQPVVALPNHRVDYQGVLSLENASIEGQWVIRHQGFWGRWLPVRASGKYRLFKKR